MNKYFERAKQLRKEQTKYYNCAQATIVPFAKDAGLDEDLAYNLTSNYGRGMKRASVCGAISAGLMVLGLYGADDAETVSEYYRRLKENHEGYLDCADLLRINKEKGGDKKEHCDGMVFEAVNLAYELLSKNGKL